MVYPYNRLLLSNKKLLPIDLCNNMDESQNKNAEWNKSDEKEHTLYDSIYIKFSILCK